MPLRAQLFWHSKRFIADRFPRLNRIHSRLWMQLLGPGALEEVTRLSYSGTRTGGFEDAGHNLSGLFEWDETLLRAGLGEKSRILVMGAGAGREVIALARMGHEVVGLEPSATLVEAGRAILVDEQVSATLLLSSPSQIPGSLGTFDAVMIGRGVYHHIPRQHRRIAFLENCARHLAPGGALLISDTLMRDDAGDHGSRWKALGRMEAGDTLGHGFFHYFTQDEFAEEVETAGFIAVRFHVSPVSVASGDTALGQVFARAPSPETVSPSRS